jgi:HAD superfamily hydrolase (TIGR01509 family)
VEKWCAVAAIPRGFSIAVCYHSEAMKRKQISRRAILFDWDGTLLNSYAADLKAYLAMFRALGIDWTERHLALHYSPNWQRVYRAARLPRSKWMEADRLWTRAYKVERPPLLAGARAVVRQLAGKFTMGIVTSGNRERVRRQLREFELADYFSACVCSEDTAKKKPDPAPLQLALRRLRVHAEDCVYVGDTAEDMEMAQRSGVHAIGIYGPFPTAVRLRAAEPEIILDSIRELPGYLRSIW